MTESLRAPNSDSLIISGSVPQVSTDRQGNEISQDNIDLRFAKPNPDLFIEKEKSENLPIWKTKKAEIYFSNSSLERYVIHRYDPEDEDVKKFPKFDANDPLPHHYYKSRKEYEEACRIYVSGSYPDKLIDLNIFFNNF